MEFSQTSGIENFHPSQMHKKKKKICSMQHQFCQHGCNSVESTQLVTFVLVSVCLVWWYSFFCFHVCSFTFVGITLNCDRCLASHISWWDLFFPLRFCWRCVLRNLEHFLQHFVCSNCFCLHEGSTHCKKYTYRLCLYRPLPFTDLLACHILRTILQFLVLRGHAQITYP